MIRVALSSSALVGADYKKVLDVAREAGAHGVEWTDQGFVAPGDARASEEVMFATLRAGLCTVSYATMCRTCMHDRTLFRQALETTHQLNAPVLRLWSAPRDAGSGTASNGFVETARALGDEAGKKGVTLCFGLSADSMLHSSQHAAELLSAMDHPFVKLALEPSMDARFDDAMETLTALAGMTGLVMVHAGDVCGQLDGKDDRAEEWLQYLDAYDEQGDSPDMTRAVVIKSLKDGDDGHTKLCASIDSIRSWATTLRRYHKRRVL